jgi:hypothetical protein
MDIPTEKLKSSAKKLARKDIILTAVVSATVGAVGGAYVQKRLMVQKSVITVELPVSAE